MAHIVTSNCVKCRFTDCVEVCPVECFYPVPEQLVIDPEECIDCGACIPECPVEAIYAEDEITPDQQEFIEINAKLSAELKAAGTEAITEPEDPLPGAEERKQALGF
ncbi:MAG: ferredoxin family protein [bacterium]|nr:ferredoxin family protein [bacterium]